MASGASWSDEKFARRPWLSFYLPSDGCKLAQRISAASADSDPADEGGEDTALPFELWVVIAAHLPHFASICRLACTGRALRPLGWHQQTWDEARARAQRGRPASAPRCFGATVI